MKLVSISQGYHSEVCVIHSLGELEALRSMQLKTLSDMMGS